MEFSVQDSSTGEVIPGAQVMVGNAIYEASEAGIVTIERPGEVVPVRVSAEGYIAMSGEIGEDTAPSQAVSLRPATLVGQLVDQGTGEPIEGATVSVVDATGTVRASTQTDAGGTYRLTDIPDNATVEIDAGRYGAISEPIGDRVDLSLGLELRVAEGMIFNDRGEPLQGAIVRSGEITAVTGGDGSFILEGVGDGAELSITASGFERSGATVSAGRIDDVSMARQLIKAVYANHGILGSPDGLDSLIEIANTTEINAIVVDVKQDTIYYDSEVQFFRDTGIVRPLFDLDETLAKLEANNIYAIARMVVFQDPLVAQARPDLAVEDSRGGLWVNVDGVAWVNAFKEELWDANIALAVELVERGFQEVQYDYVRFPTDGDLNYIQFDREYTAEAREDAITEFMRRSKIAVNEAGAYLAADLFGFITLVDDEQWIGQRFSRLEPHLDFVCMMIYPSHFETGNIASAPGHPNDYPYETIYESLQRAEQLVPGSSAKFRPWLQDFSYGFMGLRDYTPDDVRAQIDAAEEFGASGWMLWGNPRQISVEALKPDPGDS